MFNVEWFCSSSSLSQLPISASFFFHNGVCDRLQYHENDTTHCYQIQARPLLVQARENDDFNALVDPRLQNDYDSSEMTRMAACAAACVRHSARLRPRMSQVIY